MGNVLKIEYIYMLKTSDLFTKIMFNITVTSWTKTNTHSSPYSRDEGNVAWLADPVTDEPSAGGSIPGTWTRTTGQNI